MTFVRFEAAMPGARGAHPGAFALANGLARSGRLSDEDRAWWRAANDWFNAAYLNPATVDATLFDRSPDRIVSCWFKDSATHLLERLPGYLDLLDRHGVAWVQRRSEHPGRIRYEDAVQVVVETCVGTAATTPPALPPAR